MKIKNKLYIFFVIFFLIVTFFTTSFCADNSLKFNIDEGTYNGNYEIYLPSDYLDYPYVLFIKYLSSQDYFLLFSKDKIYVDIYKESTICHLDISTSSDFYMTSQVRGSSISFSNEKYILDYSTFDITNSKFTHLNNTYTHSSYGEFKIFSSNFDVYNNSGELVFQGAPAQVVKIPGIQQVEEIPQVMEQVLRILIPIGLIVFSIGLVIYLTRLVISRVQ